MHYDGSETASRAMEENAGPQSTVVEPEPLERLVWTLAKISLAPGRTRRWIRPEDPEDPDETDRGL